MTDSPEHIRGIIRQFLSFISARNWDGVRSLGAPDATYWLSGLQEKIPLAGSLPYADRVAQMPEIFGRMVSLDLNILAIVVEGDTGVAELEARGVGPGEAPRIYENTAMLRFVVRDGKIWLVREHVDFFAFFKYFGEQV